MDTRSKIVSPEQLPVGDVVLSTFDVLTVERVRRLREIRRDAACLIAVLTEEPGSLLSVTARAELAASLALVDWVVITDDPTPLTRRAARVYDEREEDRRRAADLVQYVRYRNLA